MVRDQLVVAMREFEEAGSSQPGDRKIWEAAGRLWERRLFQLVSDENLNVAQLEPQLKKVEAFHAAAQKQFPGEPLHPSMAGALFEVGRGYFNVGRLAEAMEYLERSIAHRAAGAVARADGRRSGSRRATPRRRSALFERAIALPKGDKAERALLARQAAPRARRRARDRPATTQAPRRRARRRSPTGTCSSDIGLDHRRQGRGGHRARQALYQLGDRDARSPTSRRRSTPRPIAAAPTPT